MESDLLLPFRCALGFAFHREGELAWVEGKRRAKAWKAAPLCLMWALWKERNGKAYNDVERTDQAIKYSFVYYFLNWAMVYIEDHTLYLVDFIDWLFVKG